MGYLPSFSMLWAALADCFQPVVIIQILGATTLGIIFGCLPGLTATMGCALLTSLTYGLNVFNALAILIGNFIGAIYGGSRSAILVNIPGTPAAAATALDGYEMAKQGKAQIALSAATTASFVGTLFGLVVLLFISPPLSNIALGFGAQEYFLLTLFGIMVCGSITSSNPIKGWITGLFGLLVATVGLDAIQAYPRYTFGNIQLNGGIALIPAMIGVFAVPEIIDSLQNIDNGEALSGLGGGLNQLIKDTKESFVAVWNNMGLVLRSGGIGTLIGALPGAGADIACWVVYDMEKRMSKNKENFGKGAIEGVLAPEVANNAVIGGAFIPMLTLAVPGDATTAVILAALWLHGVRPGPLLMREQPDIFYSVVALIFVGAFAMMIIGQLITPILARAVMIPKGQLMPIVVVLAVIGSYAINNRVFDVLVMLVFGLIGHFMRKFDYQAAPLTLGIILGTMSDENLRRSLMLSGGSLAPYVQRPISIIFLVVIVSMILLEVRKAVKRRPLRTAAETNN